MPYLFGYANLGLALSRRSLPCFPGRGEVKRGRLEPPQALGCKTPAEQSNAITLCFSYLKRQFMYGDKNKQIFCQSRE